MTPRKLKVTLWDGPKYPFATLFCVWEQSRTSNPVPPPRVVQQILDTHFDFVDTNSEIGQALVMLGETEMLVATEMSEGVFTLESSSIMVAKTKKRLWDTIDQILDEDIPCTENLHFVFALENIPISLREQLVRHRIGVTVGENFGVDIIPDLPSSTWWSQTMRVIKMENFVDDGRVMIPKSIRDDLGEYTESDGPGQNASGLVFDLLAEIQYVYNRLVEIGVPTEDARQILPLCTTHSITWTLNLKAMAHILGKRACWVAQVNLWGDLVAQMVDEMCTISPKFRRLCLPPCFKKGKFSACPYEQINRERIQGRDHMPPCPMFVNYEPSKSADAMSQSRSDTGQAATWQVGGGEMNNVFSWLSSNLTEWEMLLENKARFEKLWKLDVRTGEALA